MAHRRTLLAVLTGCVLAAPATALADSMEAAGGAAAPGPMDVGQAACADGQQWRCSPGQRLTLRGDGLDGAQTIAFLGGPGSRDDRRVAPVAASAHSLTLIVPRGAKTGPLRLTSAYVDPVRTAESLTVTPYSGRAQAGAADGTFPIQGPHRFGQTTANRFGGPRGHQGQDVFADCGTPLVAVLDATVQFAGRQSRAGNYVVLQDAAGRSYAYMHMRDPALVRKGEAVTSGQPVGFVGETGRASGCHLHFELWTAPGWYEGGHPVDPLPQLRSWDSAATAAGRSSRRR